MTTYPQTFDMNLEHNWDVSPAQAITIQEELRQQTILTDDFDQIQTVAGVDVGFDKTSNSGRAAIAVLHLPELELMETAVVEMVLHFPYVPGLLSFREIPVILKALERLSVPPDLLLCDGQGYAHPRRLGIASHLGILADIPAIGVAKTRLIGTHDTVPKRKGSWARLMDTNEVIGAVLRTRENVKPLYISAGHRVSLATSLSYVMQCVTRYKLPETTRQAHALSLFSKKHIG